MFKTINLQNVFNLKAQNLKRLIKLANVTKLLTYDMKKNNKSHLTVWLHQKLVVLAERS